MINYPTYLALLYAIAGFTEYGLGRLDNNIRQGASGLADSVWYAYVNLAEGLAKAVLNNSTTGNH